MTWWDHLWGVFQGPWVAALSAVYLVLGVVQFVAGKRRWFRPKLRWWAAFLTMVLILGATIGALIWWLAGDLHPLGIVPVVALFVRDVLNLRTVRHDNVNRARWERIRSQHELRRTNEAQDTAANDDGGDTNVDEYGRAVR